MNEKTIRVSEEVYNDWLQHINNLEKELDRKDTYILSLEEKLKSKDIIYKEMKQNYNIMEKDQQKSAENYFDLLCENQKLHKQLNKLKERVYQELTPEREKVLLKEIKNIQMPIVLLDFYDEFDDVDSVISDNFFGAYELTNFLVSKGHREIGFIGNLYSTSSIQDRFLGYYKSLLEHKLLLNQEYTIDDRDEQGAYIEIELPDQIPSAFVCNCDQVAHNLISKLNEKGYKVPGDCSVVGFDNDIYAEISSPKLTTVEVNLEEMANTAVRFIIEKVKGNNLNHGRVSIKGSIIYRDSVKELEAR